MLFCAQNLACTFIEVIVAGLENNCIAAKYNKEAKQSSDYYNG